jgi:hypothetical protein
MLPEKFASNPAGQILFGSFAGGVTVELMEVTSHSFFVYFFSGLVQFA